MKITAIYRIRHISTSGQIFFLRATWPRCWRCWCLGRGTVCCPEMLDCFAQKCYNVVHFKHCSTKFKSVTGTMYTSVSCLSSKPNSRQYSRQRPSEKHQVQSSDKVTDMTSVWFGCWRHSLCLVVNVQLGRCLEFFLLWCSSSAARQHAACFVVLARTSSLLLHWNFISQ